MSEKQRVGRPALPTELRRSNRVTLRFTRDEMARITRLAHRNRMSPAAYLVTKALRC